MDKIVRTEEIKNHRNESFLWPYENTKRQARKRTKNNYQSEWKKKPQWGQILGPELADFSLLSAKNCSLGERATRARWAFCFQNAIQRDEIAGLQPVTYTLVFCATLTKRARLLTFHISDVRDACGRVSFPENFHHRNCRR